MKTVVGIMCVAGALTLGAWAENAGDGQGDAPDLKPAPPGKEERQKPAHGPFHQELLKRFDADGDGKLSETERAAAEAARKEMMEKKALERFTAIDTDGNGCVSKEEWLADAKKRHEEMQNRPMKRHRRGPEEHGNNGVGNGEDPAPPGNPPENDGPGTGPGDPGNKGGKDDIVE